MAINVQISELTVSSNPYWLDIGFYVDSWSKSKLFRISYSGVDLNGDHYFSKEQLAELIDNLKKIYGFAPFDKEKVNSIFKTYNGQGDCQIIRLYE